jgi:carbamoyltransferase
MIVWGITGNNHDSSLAVMHYGVKGLTDHHHLQLLWAGMSKDFSGVPGDPNLCPEMLAHVRTNPKWAHPAKIYWYEKPFKKSVRQLLAGQGFKFKENSVKKFLQQQGIFTPIEYVDHHHSHAAYGYYTSPFKDAAVVVLDSIGEFETFTIWHGHRNKLEKKYSQNYPHSIGLFYSAMTQRLGFKANAEEYKLEQLSQQGKWRKYYRLMMEEIIKTRMPFVTRLNLHRGCNWWRPELNSEQDRADLAATTQHIFEQVLMCASAWIQMNIKTNNIVLVGGCALNRTARTKLASVWDDIWVPKNPGDPGSCVGAVCAKFEKHIDFREEMWYNNNNG